MTKNPHLPGESEDLNVVGAHCPLCGAEYRPGFELCADDETPLVKGPAPEFGPWNPAPEDDPLAKGPPAGMATAVVCALPFEEAYLLAGRLRDEGLEAFVDPPDFAAYYGKILIKSFDVIVPPGQLDEAKRIYDSVQEA